MAASVYQSEKGFAMNTAALFPRPDDGLGYA